MNPKGGDKMKEPIFFTIEPKDIFTVSEAAKYLTVSKSTIYKLLHTGQLEYIMIGCRYKIEASAILNFLEYQKGD